jgi:NAD+ diphosphatase
MTQKLWASCKGFAHQAAIRNHLAAEVGAHQEETTYPEPINLPFNFSSIKADFEFRHGDSNTNHDDSYWVILQGGGIVLQKTPNGLGLPCGPLPEWLITKHHPLLIGMWRTKPLYAISVSPALPLQDPFVSDDFNANQDHVDIQTLTLAGLAKQILHWEHQSRNCPRCGAASERLKESWGTHCTSCNTHHFPHIHPCAIILVKRGNELLLTRKAEWVAGRYSLVAGFLDFGESLEECAIREVREETGIEICNVRYVGSQNWPFPAQLMAGFVADYAGGEIRVDHNELEDARWFQADAMPLLPGKRSIARWIIDNFK